MHLKRNRKSLNVLATQIKFGENFHGSFFPIYKVEEDVIVCFYHLLRLIVV